jgi:hypothetical protein
MSKRTDQAAAAAAGIPETATPAPLPEAREIPNPPGGGSWTWDGENWISNDPVVETAVTTPE